MKRSHALAMSGLALFLATSTSSQAQAIRPGQQCQPAVANASMYGNCRLRMVRGQEVCRCAILPQALQRLNRDDRDTLATGAIGPGPMQATSPAVASGFNGRTGTDSMATGAATSGSSLGAVAAAPAASSAGAGANSGANSTGSAGISGGGGSAAGAVADSSTGRSSGGGSASGRAGGSDGRSTGSDNSRGNGPGNNNGLGNGSEPADYSDTDVKGTDPSNPGGGNGGGRGGGNGNGGGKR